MSEFPEFEHRLENEVDLAISLVNSFLPESGVPEMHAEGGWTDAREYGWKKGKIRYDVAHVTFSSGFEHLVASTRELDAPEKGKVTTRAYTLQLPRGEFTVEREGLNPEDLSRANKYTFEEYMTQKGLEYELGNLYPDPDDWDKFIEILEAGKSNAQKQKVSRFGWLRAIFGR